MSVATSPKPPVVRKPDAIEPPAPPRRRSRRNLLPYLLVLPALIAELSIHIIPMFLGIYTSFIRLNQVSIRNWIAAPFVGLENYMRGLDPAGAIGSQFFETLLRTIVYTILVVGLSWMLGTAAAYYLSTNFRGRAFFRTFFLIPYAIPAFVGVIAWAFIFNQRDGLVNSVLVDQLHIVSDRPFWLVGPGAFFVIVVVSVWSLWPFAFLLQLAALQSVPAEVHEAASLDGAGRMKTFFRVTLPMIRASNVVLILLMFLASFNQFNVPFVLFGISSPKEAQLISPLIYQFSFGTWNFGLGAAVSTLLLVFLVIVTIIYVRLVMPKEKATHA
ncbi:carbohydrate ABC transporter permease [Subtercola frigoramans]|uniref:Multiple sugar transport system permease protein n=1 Tax=Subtercola frigoramans TaxID=120298 RepID=A0ABS2L7N7_9MICO|nr:sugar ABC transporter permease [Subtercola frigoramans]MBM7473112.1 multiple sugar transport system permease protein [Subtercola frigoramans]